MSVVYRKYLFDVDRYTSVPKIHNLITVSFGVRSLSCVICSMSLRVSFGVSNVLIGSELVICCLVSVECRMVYVVSGLVCVW